MLTFTNEKDIEESEDEKSLGKGSWWLSLTKNVVALTWVKF